MLLIVLAILACVLAGLWIYGRWNFGVLEKMGIPVVEGAHLFLGHTKDIYTKVGGLTDTKWRKKYGRIFGVYEGRQPQLFICVPELVRLICVKDADYFNDKRRLDFNDPIMNEMPDFQEYEKWKLLRSLSTPAFTSAKVKMMNLPMKEAILDFISDLKRKIKASDKSVHEKLAIDEAVHTMLTDLIARCVFSIKVSGGSNDNELSKIVKEMVTPAHNLGNLDLMMWGHTFPFIRKFLSGTIFKPEPVQNFVRLFKQMMANRRQSGQKMNDIVDMMMESFDKLDTPEFREAKVTELSLLCQALVFFFATQDQVSTMVAGVIYHMSLSPELEKRIYKEVDEIFAKHNGKIGHEHLNEFSLMNSCINECLRLYPFFHRTERVCTKDWTNEEYGLDIKKGTIVIFPVWAINRDSEYTENAEEFDPDRFLGDNKNKLNPYATTSFGFGPRNCTGKRFATEAMPLILAYLLKELKFVKRKDTQLEFTPGGPFMAPHEPIYVDVMER